MGRSQSSPEHAATCVRGARAVSIISGATPIQEAASKLRSVATLFGPEQKAAANAWIKKVTTSTTPMDASGLLEEQIMLFGTALELGSHRIVDALTARSLLLLTSRARSMAGGR